ncbi:MAG: hypothetical protein SAK29_35825, partial [Scytonema sp. PMC 1069.18]|nr:hypothetical protein [Scytonema sp. PMC 1069.18]
IYIDEAHEQFLKWIIEDFWVSLVRQLPELSRNKKIPKVKFITVVTLNTSFSKEFLNPFLTRIGNFNHERIVEIQLKKWKEQDILEWLFGHSILRSPEIGSTETEIETIAKVVYRDSQGQPITARVILMKELERILREKSQRR